MEINGKGNQRRDFIYVDAVVEAFVLAGFIKKKMEGKTYNVSSGHMTSLTKIINTIKKNAIDRGPAALLIGLSKKLMKTAQRVKGRK